VLSSHGREQNYNPFFYQIGDSLLLNERKEVKNIEEIRKPLMKKCRVYSGNNNGFNNIPSYH
jgi:hypothetical protein